MFNRVYIFFCFYVTVEDVSAIFVTAHTDHDEEVGPMIGLPCHSPFVGVGTFISSK